MDPLTFFSTGKFNRLLGWTLLTLGMATLAFLDPWIFSEEDPGQLLDSTRMQLRHAQGVMLAMALLQLVVGYVLTTEAFQPQFNLRSSLITGIGALLYTGGYTLMIWEPSGKWLVLAGCSLNLLAFVKSIGISVGGTGARHIRWILPILCFGMFLDLLTSLLILFPDQLATSWLGNEDQVRLRMLRLARVAAIALTVLTLLYFDLTSRIRITNRLTTWGHHGWLGGTVGMPLILALACFTFTGWKYLLPIPATLVCLGAVAAMSLAWKHGTRLERLGWTVITSSLFVGMLVGMYAFDGPLPAPPGMEQYQGMGRRLLRIGHAYTIVLGIIALFLAERFQRQARVLPAQQIGIRFFVASLFIIPSTLVLVGCTIAPTWATGIGPACTALGLALSWTWTQRDSLPTPATTP